MMSARMSAPRQPTSPSLINTPLLPRSLPRALRVPAQGRSLRLLPLLPPAPLPAPARNPLPPPVLPTPRGGRAHGARTPPELPPRRADRRRISGRAAPVFRGRRTSYDSYSRCTSFPDLAFVAALLVRKAATHYHRESGVGS